MVSPKPALHRSRLRRFAPPGPVLALLSVAFAVVTAPALAAPKHDVTKHEAAKREAAKPAAKPQRKSA